MRRRYKTADVFTDSLFGGNPVAVVLDAQDLSTAQMQAIALEFNYSESTFVLPPKDAKHTARVRIFTPRTEVPFAGHPNVGTAFVLAHEPEFRAATERGEMLFEEAAGLVPISLINEDATIVGAELTAPEPLSLRSRITAEAAAGCLSLRSGDIEVSRHPPQVASVGLPFLIVEVKSREALGRARPNLAELAKQLPRDGADAVFLYFEPREQDEAQRLLHARMFSPFDGIVEDPATGSASAATIAMLSSLSEERTEQRSWRIHQGDDMGRPSVLLGRTQRHAKGVDTFIGGRCIAVLQGTLPERI